MTCTIVTMPVPVTAEEEFERLIKAFVEKEMSNLASRFSTIGVPFNQEAFSREGRHLVDDLVRIALFHGAEMNLTEAVRALKTKRLKQRRLVS